MKTNNEIKDFLSNLSTDIYILDYIDILDIDINNAYESIYNMIDDNGGFDIDIIYSTDAINYLKENDPSLSKSIEIASDLGVSIGAINSSLLASLLASQNVRYSFSQLESQIDEFFREY